MNGKIAFVWSSDGGDMGYLKYSIASVDRHCSVSHDFYILTKPEVDLREIEHRFKINRIDPTTQLKELGIIEHQHFGKWKLPIFYKLTIPFFDIFKDYSTVCSLDSDLLVLNGGSGSIDLLKGYPLGDYEIAGASDQYRDGMRCFALTENDVPEDLREELQARIWSKAGTKLRNYINVGFLIWNVNKIDIEWLKRRVASFWTARVNNPTSFHFPEQDFANSMMLVDAGLSIRFNCLGGTKYNEKYICARHYVGRHKAEMIELGRKTYGF